MLCSTTIIAETLKKTELPVLNYFCTYPNNSSLHLFSSLTQQLLRHFYASDRSLPGALQLSLSQLYGCEEQTPSLPDLQDQLFLPLLKKFPGCYIIVDGIDECDSRDSEQLLKYLEQIKSEVFVRLFISTREHAHLHKNSDVLYLDRIQSGGSSAKADLETFVDEQLNQQKKSGELLEDDHLRSEVRTELLRKADGM